MQREQIDYDNDDEVFYNFPSEHSSGYPTSDAEPSALGLTTEKLFQMI